MRDEALPAVPHLFPLAAWITGVCACFRCEGESFGGYERDQGDHPEKLLHDGSPVFG